jgi:hypothetical protein
MEERGPVRRHRDELRLILDKIANETRDETEANIVRVEASYTKARMPGGKSRWTIQVDTFTSDDALRDRTCGGKLRPSGTRLIIDALEGAASLFKRIVGDKE